MRACGAGLSTDVFFIDEIHAVPRGLCELLYQVIGRGRVRVASG
jgi:Holliday junction resolvasome RuvABC ATP-dependent DNA helicase subunit